jgi:hypothetical protein
MKVKMLTGMQGPTTSRNRGEIHEVDDGEAQRLVDAGFAELLPGESAKTKAPESTALAGAPEAAVKPAARRRPV